MKFIVDIDSTLDRDTLAMLMETRLNEFEEVSDVTVTLAEPLQVRDTMPEARIAAMERSGEVLP